MKLFIILITSLIVLLLLFLVILPLTINWPFKISSKDNYDKDNFNTKLTGKINVNIDKLSMPFILNGKVNERKLLSKKKMNHENQKNNLLLLKQVLESHNIKYFIDCGTLLGAVRDKDFIKGDKDADISLARNDLNLVKEKLLPKLEKLGFILFRDDSSSLLRKGEYIDLYSLHKTHIPFELIPYPFLGTHFPVPKYYNIYLSTAFKNWRVPSKQSSMDSEWIVGMPSYVKKFGLTQSDRNNIDKTAKELCQNVNKWSPLCAKYN